MLGHFFYLLLFLCIILTLAFWLRAVVSSLRTVPKPGYGFAPSPRSQTYTVGYGKPMTIQTGVSIVL